MKKVSNKTATKPKPTKKIKSTNTERAVPLNVDNNSSVNIREIANGYLVSESGYTGKGKNQQYYNKEYFSPTNPVAGIAPKVKFGKR